MKLWFIRKIASLKAAYFLKKRNVFKYLSLKLAKSMSIFPSWLLAMALNRSINSKKTDDVFIGFGSLRRKDVEVAIIKGDVKELSTLMSLVFNLCPAFISVVAGAEVDKLQDVGGVTKSKRRKNGKEKEGR